MSKEAGISAAVVVPTYNHAQSTARMLDELKLLGLPIIVVDDGATDDTRQVLTAWAGANPGTQLVIARHERNRGKAAALRTGFIEARKLAGVTHVVTIDADGQLDAADIPRLLEVAARDHRALVLGSRPRVIEGCPHRCLVGRQCASIAVMAETGKRLSDTQCGLRVYPLEVVESVRCGSGRYAFESEIITRALWAGHDVLEAPVACRYFVGGKRVSHFRPVSDSFRHIWIHTRLLLRRLAPWPRAGVGARQKNDAKGGEKRGWVRRLVWWINPLRCWRSAAELELGRLEFAAAMALGAWIGTLPFFGFHTAMSVYVAWRLHLHPVPMVLGSQVSIPPVGVALAAVSVWVGHLVLTGTMLTTADAKWTGAGGWGGWGSLPRLALEWLPAWTVGSVIVGFVLALGVFGVGLIWDAVMRRKTLSAAGISPQGDGGGGEVTEGSV